MIRMTLLHRIFHWHCWYGGFFVHGNVITLCFTVALPFPRVRMVFRGHFRSELPYRKR